MKTLPLIIASGFLFSSVHAQIYQEEFIGYTYYDLQTNGSIGNWIVNNQDETVSAVWTFSPSSLPGFPQRSVGYSFFDSTAWVPGSVTPNVRFGFPALTTTASGREIIIAQSSTSGNMVLLDRPVRGNGTWTLRSNVFSAGPGNDAWPRAAASHDTVYAIWQGSGTSGVPLFGQQGPILFSRSINGGLTWPIVRTRIPPIDSSHYCGFRGDSYSIDARNGVVAIAYGDRWTDVGLLKSTDGGMNWTKTIVNHFPVPFYSCYPPLPPTGRIDTFSTSMGDPHVLIDDHGMCHVFFSQLLAWKDSANTAAGLIDSTTTKSDALLYWNETMPPGNCTTIASSIDFSGNGRIDFATPGDPTCTLVGEYGGGLTQMPSAGFDPATENIFVTYQSTCEYCDTVAYHQLHKHVYIIHSADYGQTWSTPYDIVPSVAMGGDGEYREAVFACIAKNVDQNVYIVYQRDPAPGTSLNTANSCETANNAGATDVIAVTINTQSLILGVRSVQENNVILSQNYPNPVHGPTVIKATMKKSEDIDLFVTDIFGRTLFSESRKNSGPGISTYILDTSSWPQGIYLYTMRTKEGGITKRIVVE